MKTRFLMFGMALASATLAVAAPLSEGTFTDVIKDVEVLDQPTKNASPARLNELVKSPNLIRTGAASRAELTASDQTLTRIGANTVFSFAPAGREISLEKGSVLFHSPSGRGGGTIRSGGASAAVSGTTLIVATTPVTNPGDKNGFKVILLEGTGRVTLPNGHYQILKAGQLIFILPNHDDFGPLLTINLGRLVSGSTLVQGFSHPLPSLDLIQIAIQQQQKALSKGTLGDTGTPADNFASTPPLSGGVDPNTYQVGINFAPVQNGNNGGAPFTPGPTLVPPTTPPPVIVKRPPLPQSGTQLSTVGSGSTFGASSGSSGGVLIQFLPPAAPIQTQAPIIQPLNRPQQPVITSIPSGGIVLQSLGK